MQTELNINDILENEDAKKLMEKTKPFAELMMKYKCALREIKTKFQVLDDEFSVRYNRNPVETIKTRIKEPMSIIQKLKRKDIAMSVENIRNNIFDIAGIRIICSFPSDIYRLADMLIRQDDVTLIKMKDYIKKPKENGYRSLHLIVEIPVFLTDTTENMCVEVQFRTIAMDFWASLEHKLKYKKDVDNGQALSAELKSCADEITKLDMRMQLIHEHIDGLESYEAL